MRRRRRRRGGEGGEVSVAGAGFGSRELDADALLDELEDALDPQSAVSGSPTRARARLDADSRESRDALGANWRESQDARVRDADTRLAGGGGGGGGGESRSEGQLKEWLAACWGMVEEWGHLSSKDGPEHTAMVFGGELPRSPHAKWLEEREGERGGGGRVGEGGERSELKQLLLTAFRYRYFFELVKLKQRERERVRERERKRRE
jgi:hypothetical protein